MVSWDEHIKNEQLCENNAVANITLTCTLDSHYIAD